MAALEVAAAPAARAQRFRNACFTINNPAAHGVPNPMFAALPDWATYIVWQQELGDNGTPHYQGYVEFVSQRTLPQIHRLFSWAGVPSGIHAEKRRGTAAQASAYCKKADTRTAGPWEFGNISQQGRAAGDAERRAQALATVDALRAGTMSLREAPAEAMLDHPAALKLAVSMATAPRRDAMHVYYVEGGTGVGKSHNVFRCFPDAFRPTVSGDKIWFDGYGNQDTLFLDELRGCIKMSFLLQLLDPYPIHVEFKGGMVPARWSRVIICTNTPPAHWYRNMVETDPLTFAALMRRIHHVERVPGSGLWGPDGEMAALVYSREECSALFDRWFPQ